MKKITLLLLLSLPFIGIAQCTLKASYIAIRGVGYAGSTSVPVNIMSTTTISHDYEHKLITIATSNDELKELNGTYTYYKYTQLENGFDRVVVCKKSDESFEVNFYFHNGFGATEIVIFKIGKTFIIPIERSTCF